MMKVNLLLISFLLAIGCGKTATDSSYILSPSSKPISTSAEIQDELIAQRLSEQGPLNAQIFKDFPETIMSENITSYYEKDFLTSLLRLGTSERVFEDTGLSFHSDRNHPWIDYGIILPEGAGELSFLSESGLGPVAYDVTTHIAEIGFAFTPQGQKTISDALKKAQNPYDYIHIFEHHPTGSIEFMPNQFSIHFAACNYETHFCLKLQGVLHADTYYIVHIQFGPYPEQDYFSTFKTIKADASPAKFQSRYSVPDRHIFKIRDPEFFKTMISDFGIQKGNDIYLEYPSRQSFEIYPKPQYSTLPSHPSLEIQKHIKIEPQSVEKLLLKKPLIKTNSLSSDDEFLISFPIEWKGMAFTLNRQDSPSCIAHIPDSFSIIAQSLTSWQCFETSDTDCIGKNEKITIQDVLNQMHTFDYSWQVSTPALSLENDDQLKLTIHVTGMKGGPQVKYLQTDIGQKTSDGYERTGWTGSIDPIGAYVYVKNDPFESCQENLAFTVDELTLWEKNMLKGNLSHPKPEPSFFGSPVYLDIFSSDPDQNIVTNHIPLTFFVSNAFAQMINGLPIYDECKKYTDEVSYLVCLGMGGVKLDLKLCRDQSCSEESLREARFLISSVLNPPNQMFLPDLDRFRSEMENASPDELSDELWRELVAFFGEDVLSKEIGSSLYQHIAGYMKSHPHALISMRLAREDLYKGKQLGEEVPLGDLLAQYYRYKQYFEIPILERNAVAQKVKEWRTSFEGIINQVPWWQDPLGHLGWWVTDGALLNVERLSDISVYEQELNLQITNPSLLNWEDQYSASVLAYNDLIGTAMAVPDAGSTFKSIFNLARRKSLSIHYTPKSLTSGISKRTQSLYAMVDDILNDVGTHRTLLNKRIREMEFWAPFSKKAKEYLQSTFGFPSKKMSVAPQAMPVRHLLMRKRLSRLYSKIGMPKNAYGSFSPGRNAREILIQLRSLSFDSSQKTFHKQVVLDSLLGLKNDVPFSTLSHGIMTEGTVAQQLELSLGISKNHVKRNLKLSLGKLLEENSLDVISKEKILNLIDAEQWDHLTDDLIKYNVLTHEDRLSYIIQNAVEMHESEHLVRFIWDEREFLKSQLSQLKNFHVTDDVIEELHALMGRVYGDKAGISVALAEVYGEILKKQGKSFSPAMKDAMRENYIYLTELSARQREVSAVKGLAQDKLFKDLLSMNDTSIGLSQDAQSALSQDIGKLIKNYFTGFRDITDQGIESHVSRLYGNSIGDAPQRLKSTLPSSLLADEVNICDLAAK